MFKEIYYWIYTYLSRIKTNKSPAFNAYAMICVFQIINIATLGALINYFIKIDFTRKSATCSAIISLAVLYIINYFYLYKKRILIFNKYYSYSGSRKRKGQIYFWLYFIITVLTYFYIVAFLVKPKY